MLSLFSGTKTSKIKNSKIKCKTFHKNKTIIIIIIFIIIIIDAINMKDKLFLQYICNNKKIFDITMEFLTHGNKNKSCRENQCFLKMQEKLHFGKNWINVSFKISYNLIFRSPSWNPCHSMTNISGRRSKYKISIVFKTNFYSIFSQMLFLFVIRLIARINLSKTQEQRKRK